MLKNRLTTSWHLHILSVNVRRSVENASLQSATGTVGAMVLAVPEVKYWGLLSLTVCSTSKRSVFLSWMCSVEEEK